MEKIRALGGGVRRCLLCVAWAGSFAAAAAVTRMDYPDANTVLLDDITRVEYAADGTFVIENDERIVRQSNTMTYTPEMVERRRQLEEMRQRYRDAFPPEPMTHEQKVSKSKDVSLPDMPFIRKFKNRKR